MTKQELAKQIKKWREEAHQKWVKKYFDKRNPIDNGDFINLYLAEKILEMMGKPIKVDFYKREIKCGKIRRI